MQPILVIFHFEKRLIFIWAVSRNGMMFNHVAFKMNFLSAPIIAKVTTEGFFACMHHNMLSHVFGIFHYFITVKAPILSCAKFYWKNLQNNQDKKIYENGWKILISN